MDKDIGYVLVMFGIALIVIGALNVAGYLSFQTVDTTPPKIFYTFPEDKMTYKLADLSEIVVYAQDSSEIVCATYFDGSRTLTLNVTPYTKLKHTALVIEGWKYPDVNYDGKVDSTDANLVYQACISHIYNSELDINSDGIIDMVDYYQTLNYYGSVTFAFFFTSIPYSSGESITFTFSVLDSAGNIALKSGSFITTQYEELSGTWKINGIKVSESSLIEVSERKIDVVFICNETVNTQDVTVKVIIGNTINILTYVGNNTWQSSMEVPASYNILILEASTQAVTPKMNIISVVVSVKGQIILTVGHAVMLIGGLLIVGGVIVIVKKRETVW
jgi:hypothetical protein